MNKLCIICIIICLTSCALPPQKNMTADEHLRAEWHLIKTNLNLATRENEVLKEENQQYRKEIDSLNDSIRKLKVNLDELKTKYKQDIAKMISEYEVLYAQYQLHQTQSKEEIQSLLEANQALDQTLNKERKHFKQRYAAQNDAHTKTINTRTAEWEQKKEHYEKQLQTLTTNLKKEKSALITSDANLAEANKKIKALENISNKRQTINEELERKIVEQEKLIDKHQKTVAALRKKQTSSPAGTSSNTNPADAMK